MPEVSVIIPAYDAGYTIRECIESVLYVEYPKDKLEVILVNDGSHDETVQIASKYPIRIIDIDHAGPSAARNAGVKEAGGEIVAFTDADCIVSRQWLKRLVQAFSVDVGGVGGTVRPYKRSGVVDKFQAYWWGVNTPLGEVGWLPTNNAAFNRSTLLKVGGFREEFKKPGSEDIDLCVRIRELGFKLVRVESEVVHKHNYTLFNWLKTEFTYGQNTIPLMSNNPSLRRFSLRRLAYVTLVALLVALTWNPFYLFLAALILVTYHGQDVVHVKSLLGQSETLTALSFPILNFISRFTTILGSLWGMVKFRRFLFLNMPHDDPTVWTLLIKKFRKRIA